MANSVSQVLLTKARLERAAESPSRTGVAATTAEDIDPSTALPAFAKGYGAASRTSLAAGAIVDFLGVVRELEDGREIEGIDYEAHEAMAEHQMKIIADAAAETFRLNQVLLHHRIGFVRAGEASLFLRVRAQHRAAAFEASQWIVDELKKKVPIWKRARFKTERRRHVSKRQAAIVRLTGPID
jgi:molybdopterin synthase catalytic subunit